MVGRGLYERRNESNPLGMIAILMSTYNGERYLAEQLESIIAQTYTDWCLCVRDDGSRDRTPKILDEYAQKDTRISILKDKDNLGACRSFERLLEQCGEADYYAFADQDDVWTPDKLAICLEAIRKAENDFPNQPMVVHTDLQVVDEQLNEIAPSFWNYGGIVPQILDSNIHYLAICNSVTGCAMMMNRAARKAALPFLPGIFMHDAWVALMVLKAGGRVIPIPQTTIRYRQHMQNVCGAQQYRFRVSNIREKYRLAQRSYRTGHPLVFRNKIHFVWWKTIYFVILHSYRIRHKS